MRPTIIDDPRRRLHQHRNPGDCWLLCDECRRFFQYKSAPDDGCPFNDCYGHGFGFNLFLWDDMREPADPRWPSSTDELTHGMRAPNMEKFYATQLEARVDKLVNAFARSPEAATAIDGQPPCYLKPYLQTMSDLCWDLTEDAGRDYFCADTAVELTADLPVCARTADPDEAPRMAAELRAFFAFATRTAAVPCADKWRDLLADVDLEAIFRDTMQHDKRLRRLRRATTTPTERNRRKRARKARRKRNR